MGTRRQRDAFISAATQLGLSFTRGGPPEGFLHSLTMEGVVDGYAIRVKAVSGNNNNNRTHIDVLAPGLPEGMVVKPRTFTRYLPWARGGVHVGDPAWDDTMFATARDRSEAGTWLTRDRRRALLDATTRTWGPTAFLMRTPPPVLKRRRLRVSLPKIANDARELTDPILGMIALLEALGVAGDAPPMDQGARRATARTMPLGAKDLPEGLVDPFVTSGGPSGWTVLGWAMVGVIALLWILGYDGPEDTTWLAIASGVAGLGLVLAMTRH